MRWQIELFGGLVLRDAREPQTQGTAPAVQTRFYSQKAALLLARLAFPPLRAYGREEIIELLWPDGDITTGRANLRNVLSALRRQLEPEDAERGQVLYADNAQLGLRSEAVTTDVAAFEAALRRARRAGGEEEHEAALREAIYLYRGELLPGAYTDWVLAERERLGAAYTDALLSLQSLSQKQGDVAESRAIGFRLPQEVPEARQSLNPTIPVKTPQPLLSPPTPPSHRLFFGRDRECREVMVLLRAGRMVTLTGVGGVGKTRLAREIAFAFSAVDAPDAKQPAVFVPLDGIRQASQIPEKILMALGVPLRAESPGAEATAQAAEALREARVPLLVLDNAEHLLNSERETQTVVSALREANPEIRLLLTSQRALDMTEETAFLISPLPIPAPGTLSVEELLRIPSVQLFASRALAVRPDFAVTARNAAAVASVCRQLEGIPLSLEIAGARSLVTTPWQIQAELEHRLGFLTRRPAHEARTDPPRHRSLRSTLEWSHSLLSPDLTRFFARLSVFRGGFTAEAARSVCDVPDALERIEELCQASLLCPEESGEIMRFCFLDTVREFSREKLTESGEKEAIEQRHLTAFLELAETANKKLLGPEQERWLNRLEQDHDNLRAALTYAAEQADGWRSLRLSSALWRFWQTRGYLTEGSDWLAASLAAVSPQDEEQRRLWARASNGLGSLLIHANRFDEAKAALQAALDFFEPAGDPERIGPLNNLGLIYLYKGEDEAARDAFTRCLETVGTDGDPKFRSSFLNNREWPFFIWDSGTQANGTSMRL
jgi:predicted ATPase